MALANFTLRPSALLAVALVLTAAVPAHAGPLLFFVGYDRTVYAYNDLSQFERIAGTAEGLIDPSSTAYDSVNSRLYISDRANDRVYAYDYNSTKTLVKELDGDGLDRPQGMSYFYDTSTSQGLVVGNNSNSVNDTVTRYQYDALNNKLTTPPTTFEDTPAEIDNPTATAYDAQNKNFAVASKGNTTVYQYDYDGTNRTKLLDSVDGISDPTAMTYIYDSAGSKNNLYVADGTTVYRYQYDALNNFEARFTYDNSDIGRITTFSYDAVGGKLYSYDEGRNTVYQYDSLTNGSLRSSFSAPVPEPASFVMFGLGALGLWRYTRRPRNTTTGH